MWFHTVQFMCNVFCVRCISSCNILCLLVLYHIIFYCLVVFMIPSTLYGMKLYCPTLLDISEYQIGSYFTTSYNSILYFIVVVLYCIVLYYCL